MNYSCEVYLCVASRGMDSHFPPPLPPHCCCSRMPSQDCSHLWRIVAVLHTHEQIAEDQEGCRWSCFCFLLAMSSHSETPQVEWKINQSINLLWEDTHYAWQRVAKCHHSFFKLHLHHEVGMPYCRTFLWHQYYLCFSRLEKNRENLVMQKRKLQKTKWLGLDNFSQITKLSCCENILQ